MAKHAVRIELSEFRLTAVAQQHPFLTSADEALNEQLRSAVQRAVIVQEHTEDVPVLRVPAHQLRMDASQEAAAVELLRSTGMPQSEAEHALEDFGWRVAHIPAGAKSILCLGCGVGHELAFIWARLPQARIVVLDYVDKVQPGLLQAIAAEFRCCDFIAELKDSYETFDVVFSNHTLEHLYEPDQALALIRSRLAAGGSLVSGLPLDGEPSVPLSSTVARLAADARGLHQLDFGVFDLGHPWKTNSADLKSTLHRCGFADVRLVQRADVPYRTTWPAQSLAWPRALLLAFYWPVFGSLRWVLKWLFPRTVPLILRRILVALERRVPFGANRMRNSFSNDVVVSAVAVST